MGLDMYLLAKKYISNDRESVKTITSLFPELDHFHNFQIDIVQCTVGVWRKANAIHSWFVENVQDGEDDCGVYEVEREKLVELLQTIEKVMKNHDLAEELLPTSSGFFFGSTTEYDEDYEEVLIYTRDVLQKVLDEKMSDWYFSYTSSW